MRITFIILITLLGLAACNSSRDLVYLNDLRGSTEYKAQILNRTALRIQPGDLLAVSVSSLSPESSILFNNGVLAPPSTTNSTDATAIDNAVSNKLQNEGYSVDNEGFITYPVLGRIKLGDLTKEEAIQAMTAAVRKYIKRPIVDIRLLNFKVTVLGEVVRPASFTIPQESINVLEALGLAGDMTEYGRRENVLVIRERGDERVAMRLDLHKKEVFDSPYFYLQQNDIVYVEPDNRTKTAQTNPNNRFIAIWGAVISTLGYAIIAIALR